MKPCQGAGGVVPFYDPLPELRCDKATGAVARRAFELMTALASRYLIAKRTHQPGWATWAATLTMLARFLGSEPGQDPVS